MAMACLTCALAGCFAGDFTLLTPAVLALLDVQVLALSSADWVLLARLTLAHCHSGDLPSCFGREVSGGVWPLLCAGPSPRHFSSLRWGQTL